MQFNKPHLTYLEQVRLLASRGLDVGDEAAAVQALKRIGYYRLSAYTYPMRVILPKAVVGQPSREDRFVHGARLQDAVALHDFDDRLRRALLSAVQSLEVGLRTKVAYHLSKHGAMAHLTRDGLDPVQCDALAAGPDHEGTKYEIWRREYDTLQSKSRDEDYVRHFLMKYEGRVPIWAACEFLTMGSLIALYRLMGLADAGRVARELGVKNKDVLFGWLKALNVQRNHCAHNARIWNRSTTYPPDRINIRMVDSDLHHLTGVDTHKVYFMAAVLAYLLRRVDKSTRFPNEFRTVMNKFPPVLGMTPESAMGFAADWKDEPLWAVQ